MHTTLRLWDAETLKDRAQAANGRAQSALAEQDRRRAAIYIERALCDQRGIYEYCTLPGCRRARCCRGNPPVCLAADATASDSMQNAIDQIYVSIQEQRRAAAYDGRKLDLLDPVTRKLPGRR
jgi:hypothetical protein